MTNTTRNIWKDIRRSLSLMLTFGMIAGSAVSMPVGAAEQLEIIDYGNMWGIGYTQEHEENYRGDEKHLYWSLEDVVITDSGSVDMYDLSRFEAELSITIDNTKYKVVDYTYHPQYIYSFSLDISFCEDSDGYFRIPLYPVFYDNAGNPIVDNGYDNLYCNYLTENSTAKALYCPSAEYYGLSEEIIDYLASANVIDKTNIDYNAIVEFLTSKEVNKNYSVKYTLEDNSSNIEILEHDEQCLYEYEVPYYSGGTIYYFGKRISYNRIENLKDFHTNNQYNHLKMLRGNIYVDADNLSSLGDNISLPNVNNTGLFHMSSMLVGDNILYDDGNLSTTATEGYDLISTTLPEPVETKEQAVDEFLNIMFGKLYSYDDFPSDLYIGISDQNTCAINSYDGHSYKYGNNLIKICAYNEYNNLDFLDPDDIHPATISKSELTNYSVLTEDDIFLFKEYPIPEVVIDNQELNKISDYYLWIQLLSFCLPYELEYEDMFAVYSGDTAVDYCTLSEMSYLLSSMEYYMTDTGITNTSQIDITDFEENYYYTDSFLVPLEEVTHFEPLFESFEEPYQNELMLSDICLDNSWPLDSSDIAGTMQSVNLAPDTLKVWKKTAYSEVEYNSDYEAFKSAFITELKNSYSEDEYNRFINYIEDNFVIYDSRINLSETPNSGNTKTDLDVYNENLQIPLTNFSTADLGKEHPLYQLYYAGDESKYLIYAEGEPGYDMTALVGTSLYHGRQIDYYHNLGDIYLPSYPHATQEAEILFVLNHVNVYRSALGTVIFAKVPDQIDAKAEVFSTTDTYELTWDIPNDNGAEILGYQIAVIPRSNTRSLPTDEQYITVGDTAGSYTDLGDNYTITYSTTSNSYIITTNGESVDVYVRAVNVIGAGEPQKFSITNPTDITISGPVSVNAGNTANYDVLDVTDNNIEASCTYAIQNSPAGVTIDADGKLTVDEDCTVTEITITATGKTGTIYDGKTASITVTIVPKQTIPDTNPNPNPNPDTNPTPDNDPAPDPDAGNGIVSIAVITSILALTAITVILRKRKVAN